MVSEFKDVSCISELIDFIKKKGGNHNYYYHYTSWDSFKKIYEGKSFLLTRGNSPTINDQHEPTTKGAFLEWNKTYIGSFSYSSIENMAMWGLYGLPWEDAVRICIPRKGMKKWIDSIATVTTWENGSNGEVDCDRVFLTDIVYVTGISNSTNVELTHINSSIKTANLPGLQSVEHDPGMTGCIKNSAWQYENEVRLIIKLFEEVNCEKILVEIPDETIASIRVTTGPSFDRTDDDLYQKLKELGKIEDSKFHGLVKYKKLCSMCEQGEFKRKIY